MISDGQEILIWTDIFERQIWLDPEIVVRKFKSRLASFLDEV